MHDEGGKADRAESARDAADFTNVLNLFTDFFGFESVADLCIATTFEITDFTIRD